MAREAGRLSRPGSKVQDAASGFASTPTRRTAAKTRARVPGPLPQLRLLSEATCTSGLQAADCSTDAACSDKEEVPALGPMLGSGTSCVRALWDVSPHAPVCARSRMRTAWRACTGSLSTQSNACYTYTATYTKPCE